VWAGAPAQGGAGALLFAAMVWPEATGTTKTATEALRRSIVWPSWVLLGLLVAAFALGLNVPPAVQYLPFALSLVLFGLPHGAVDHLVPARLRGERAVARSVLAVAILYLVLGGSYLGLWYMAPAAAFVLFVGLTWFHWGTADVWSLGALVAPGQGAGGRVSAALVASVRGGLPMLVPLLAFPDEYRAVAESLVGLFAPAGGTAFGWAFGPSFRLAAGIGFAGLVVISLVLVGRSGGAWRADAAETALLAAYFAVVPPVLAVGLYFCLWHAVRHVARLLLLDPGSFSELRAGRVGAALGRFARDAAPLTGLALLLLVALALAAPNLAGGPSALLAVYLVLISALTLPHVVVVAFMDRKQVLWR